MNISRSYIPVICFLVLLAAQLPAFAQKKDSTLKAIGNDTVEVYNRFNPVIGDAVKLSYPAKAPVLKREKPTVTYTVPVGLAPISYPPVTIKPLAINKEKPVEYPGSYLKLGFGTQWSPLAELLYTGHKLNGDVEKLNYGIFFHHLSAYGSKIKHQDFMDNNAAVFANFYPGKFKIAARVDFENNNRFYYGYDHNLESFSKSDIKQSYNYLKLDVNLSNGKKGNLGVDHESHVVLYGLYDHFSQHDVGVDLFSDLKKTFLSSHTIYLHVEDFYNNFSNKNDSVNPKPNNNLLNVKPGYEYNGGFWKVHGAFGITLDNGTFRPSPDLGAQFNVAHNYLVVYGGWNLEVRKLTYKDLATRNWWIEDNTFALKNTRFEDRFAGLKGSAKGFTYDLQFAQRVMREMPLFINDTFNMKKFLVVYNPGTLKFFDIRWAVEYRVNSDLDFAFHGDYNLYSPQYEEKAWHLPGVLATFTANYRIAQKIFLKAEVFGVGRSYAKLAGGQVALIHGTADINLGATYKFSKYFSFFAELNNLANIKYQEYYNYPTYGFNGKLGVIFTYQK